MELLLPFLIGILFSVSIYFILHRHLFKLIMGLILFGLATNIFLFVVGGLTNGDVAIIKKTHEVAVVPYADPVPQALLLTAIVIGFGLQAFAIVLIRKVYQSFKSNNLDDLHKAE
ncbi:NADH-quinone oxidoreductase subunit K [Pontibacter sp. E15-1]|uniref:NADH-quinone oxidoreductase subunit K n=1 Tax=Pontibacter sp. E15-1 TaxID=2919918 RepID=UPI001F4FEE92|nr:NADH-quinone oxidoreductase subunit K [Pontibacter sp. E15-1]MCJ8163654.1 NADH-quinone oxidoreductase subunit K [Pontibacter sp. E15-1]